jgi:hypothetical protein
MITEIIKYKCKITKKPTKEENLGGGDEPLVWEAELRKFT